MNKAILDKATNWSNNKYFDAEAKREIQELIDHNNEKELTERFYKNLEFGTGGIRSILGMGINRINKYTIRKATQALASVILNSGTNHKIAISYDSRKFSFEFAQEAASVMAANGIKVYIYKKLNPVCLLSFAIRELNTQAGIMITASHNPPEYNGYKVYWDDGAQVTPPYDQKIIDEYNSAESFEAIKYISFNEAIKTEMIQWIGKEMEDKYFAMLKNTFTNSKMCKEHGEKIKIIYTPIHGTGLIPCTRVLEEMGLTNYKVVPEQAEPDHTFPTVSSPNPENPSAMQMGVDLMRSENADIVMGTDPDTDRLGVAIEHNGELYFPNGNQIGTLMLHYTLTNLKEQKRLPEHAYFMKTIVTTELQTTIADRFNVKTFNTLTGFKWICKKMKELESSNPELKFIFGTEESFGYMTHNFVRDKDGVCAVAIMSEIALWYKLQGMTLMDALNKIYEEYGYSKESLLCLDYKGKEGAEKISRIMSHFRNNITSKLSGIDIIEIEDYQKSETIHCQNLQITKIDLPTSNVLGYKLATGDKLYLRPSGTEPKIKFYIMISESEGTIEKKTQNANIKTDQILNFIKVEAERA